MTRELLTTSEPVSPTDTSPQVEPLPAMDHLMGIPMRAEVVLGTLQMKLREISELREGSILKTERPAGEPLDLLINSSPIAIAEIYPHADKLGLRVVKLSKID